MKPALLLILSFYFVTDGSGKVIHEDFRSLSSWKPLTFSRIGNHTKYLIRKEKGLSYLTSLSENSASGLLHRKEFSVFRYPVIRWRWRISNILKKGDLTKKSGDDSPMRIYILFKYDPEKSPFTRRLKYKAAKLVYGKYPPHSTLIYVWSNRSHEKNTAGSPYADNVRIVIKESGEKNTGRWTGETANILEDYRRAFGNDPPETAGLGIMSDTDNTGESCRADIDYITVSGR